MEPVVLRHPLGRTVDGSTNLHATVDRDESESLFTKAGEATAIHSERKLRDTEPPRTHDAAQPLMARCGQVPVD